MLFCNYMIRPRPRYLDDMWIPWDPSLPLHFSHSSASLPQLPLEVVLHSLGFLTRSFRRDNTDLALFRALLRLRLTCGAFHHLIHTEISLSYHSYEFRNDCSVYDRVSKRFCDRIHGTLSGVLYYSGCLQDYSTMKDNCKPSPGFVDSTLDSITQHFSPPKSDKPFIYDFAYTKVACINNLPRRKNDKRFTARVREKKELYSVVKPCFVFSITYRLQPSLAKLRSTQGTH